MDPVKFKEALGSQPGVLVDNPNIIGDVYQKTGIDFQSEENLRRYIEKNNISFDGFDSKPLVEKKNPDLTQTKVLASLDVNGSELQLTSTPESGTSVSTQSGISRIESRVANYRDSESERINSHRFNGITADFLDREESEVKVDLENLIRTSNFGERFLIKEAQPGKNAIELATKDGSDKIFVDLAADGLMNDEVTKSNHLLRQSAELREFLAKNTDGNFYSTLEQFNEDNFKTLYDVQARDFTVPEEYIKSMALIKPDDQSPKSVYSDVFVGDPGSKRISIDGLRLQREKAKLELEKAKKDILNNPVQSGRLARTGVNLNTVLKEGADLLTESTQKVKDIEATLSGLDKIENKYFIQKSNFSRNVAQLISASGGLKKFAGEGPEAEYKLGMLFNNGLDPRDLKLKEIQIDGSDASLNELTHFTQDGTLRQAIYNGDISVDVSDLPEGEGYEFLKPVVEKAKELERVQLRDLGSFWRGLGSMISTVGATGLEAISNIAATAMDISRISEEAAIALSLAMNDDGTIDMSDVQRTLDIKYGSMMEEDVFWKAAQSIRKEIPVTEGSISDAESLSQFFSKGAAGAAESALNMGLFIMAPPIGLANIGIGSYGSGTREMTNIRNYIAGTGDPESQYRGYKDMSVWEARALTGSKALGETLITRAFTYNFLKGLGGSAKAAKLNLNKANEMADFYTKSFIKNINPMFRKSFVNEFKEENLITVSQMWTDQLFGVKDYTFTDYAKAMKDTALQLPFLTMPMTGAAYSKMSKNSKAFTEQMIVNAVGGKDLHDLGTKFTQLDAEIKRVEDTKAEVTPRYIDDLYQRRDDVADAIVARNKQVFQDVQEVTDKGVLVKIAKNQAKIQHNNYLSRLDETNDRKKELLHDDNVKLYEENIKLFEGFDSKKQKEDTEKNAEDAKSKAEQNAKDTGNDGLTPQEQAAWMLVSSQISQEDFKKESLARTKKDVPDSKKDVTPFSLGEGGFLVRTNEVEGDVSKDTYSFYRKDSRGNVSNSVYINAEVTRDIMLPNGEFGFGLKYTDPDTGEVSELLYPNEDMVSNAVGDLAQRVTVDYESNMPDDVIQVNDRLNAWTPSWSGKQGDLESSEKMKNVINFLNVDHELVQEGSPYHEEYKKLKKAAQSDNFLDVAKAIKIFEQRVVAPTKVVREIIRNKPVAGKIAPITNLESLFTGLDGKYTMADAGHILSFLLKNDKMRTPLRNVNGAIDATLGKNAANTNRLIKDYATLSFLPGYRSGVAQKLTPKALSQDKQRKEKYLSLESNIDRTVISMMDRFDSSSNLSQDQQISRIKQIIKGNIEKLSKDGSVHGKRRSEAWQRSYNNLVEGVSNHDEFVKRAKEVSLDNYLGVKQLQSIYTPELTEATLNHMETYYGRTPRRITRYLPMILSSDNMNSTNDASDEMMLYKDTSGPGSIKDLTEFDNILETDRTIYGDNFDALVFRSYENINNEIEARANLDIMSGVLKSPEFRDMFDTEKRVTKGSGKPEADFDYMIGILNNKINSVNSTLGSTGSTMLRKSTVGKELKRALYDFASASRLGSFSMRSAQGVSAMAGASLNMSTDAANMMYESLANFAVFNLKNKQDTNNEFMKVLSRSATAARSGLDAIPGLDQAQRRKGTNVFTEKSMQLAEASQGASKFVLKQTVANSDATAGIASFAGFYYDRMKQTHPTETRNMSYSDFWAWANTKEGTKADIDAIAYADEQVNRSQLIASPQNQGNFYTNHKDAARIIFPFGKFAYNRKIGMANDISILNSELASEGDKTRARNRLKSAAAEIATFKLIQPAAATLAAKASIGALASLVGFDDEYDELVNEMNKKINLLNPASREILRQPFEVSNFTRDVQKEFYTALIDGMIPVPTPGFANELAFAGVNKLIVESGLSEDEFFNVFSKTFRDMFSDDDPRNSAMSMKDYVIMATDELGMLSMAAEDVMSIVSTYEAYMNNVTANKFSDSSPDRQFRPQVQDAVKVLAQLRALELVLPSADLKRFNRQLQGLLERKYTETIPKTMPKD
jgi:hypothetical protein